MQPGRAREVQNNTMRRQWATCRPDKRQANAGHGQSSRVIVVGVPHTSLQPQPLARQTRIEGTTSHARRSATPVQLGFQHGNVLPAGRVFALDAIFKALAFATKFSDVSTVRSTLLRLVCVLLECIIHLA